MRWKSAIAAIALALLGGCATSYVYQPTTAAAPETGYLVARYGVPSEGPQGELLVTSFGVTRMDVAPGKSIPMLHVRLGSTNTSAPVPWTLDAREQLVTIAGRGPLAPSYANSDSGGPQVTVPPGRSRVLDLYYALAPSEQSEREVPFFEVNWKVHAGDRTVAQRTSFQRTQAPLAAGAPPNAYFSVGLGWSPYWWYDPFWPYPIGTVGFPVLHHNPPPFVVGAPAPMHAGGFWRGYPAGGLGPGPGIGAPGIGAPAPGPAPGPPAPAGVAPGGWVGHPVR